MLDYIRIKNLRSLEDTGNIILNPITVLLGENSSGKSTFLRAFPLLKQSVETNTRSSILWYGKYVDYGDFDQALTRNNSGKEISFTFGLTVPRVLLTAPGMWKRVSRREPVEPEAKLVVEIRLASRGKDGLTRTAGLHFTVEDIEVDIGINEQGRISSIIIDNTDYSTLSELYSYTQAVRLLPSIHARQDTSEPLMYSRWRSMAAPEKIRQYIIREIQKHMHGKAGSETVQNVFNQMRAGGKEQMLAYFKRASSTVTWRNRTEPMTSDSPEFKIIRDLTLLARLPALIHDLDDVLDETFRRVSYTAPLRASAERYYRSQDLSVNELDFKGENLTMFVRNLSERDKSLLDSWTRKEFGFKLDVKYSNGHVTTGIEYENSKESFNLADMGFGFSQVMPIIVQIWHLLNKQLRSGDDRLVYTYVIEQPELHLHPRLQAKLAEVLIKAVLDARRNELKINLIFETHSEAIINKIGLMTSDKILSENDANIIIFSKESEKSGSTVTTSRFDSNGVLTNWPYGFFDIEV